MAFHQWREVSASLKLRKGDTGNGQHPRLHAHHYMLLLILIPLLSLVALFTAVGGRSELPVLPPHGPWRDSSIANYSDFLAFVASEPDAAYEKEMIKEALEVRARASRHPSPPHNAPLWPQFQALLRSRVALKRFDPKVMQTLVRSIKEPIDRHHLLNPPPPSSSPIPTRRYASCAVVGNSGILLNSTYGAAVDAHEAVVRLNNARAKGYETHVGRKTTISFMNSNILHKCARRLRCYCEAYNNDDVDVAIVVYISQVQHLMDLAICTPSHRAPLLVTDPRFDALTARIAKWYSVREFVTRTGNPFREWPWGLSQGFHYSSGMQAVMLALGICDEVDLYGFGKVNGTKHHYHTAQTQELPMHDYAAEHIFYHELANRDAMIPFLHDAGIRRARVRVFGFDHEVHQVR